MLTKLFLQSKKKVLQVSKKLKALFNYQRLTNLTIFKILYLGAFKACIKNYPSRKHKLKKPQKKVICVLNLNTWSGKLKSEKGITNLRVHEC